MSEELLPPKGHPLQILGERLTHYLDDDKWNECEHLLLQAWNTRLDSKPYKYETEDDWQESCGWFTSEFQEAITLAFAAARVHKEG